MVYDDGMSVTGIEEEACEYYVTNNAAPSKSGNTDPQWDLLSLEILVKFEECHTRLNEHVSELLIYFDDAFHPVQGKHH
jgi:hypothetical protein